MNWIENMLIVAGISLDVFATMECQGSLVKKINKKQLSAICVVIAIGQLIGLFLGYPLGDVIGFIKNAGQNCKCVGCWKVYYNECEAIKAFARFKKCTNVYVRLWNQGRSVRQLTVAA